MDRRDVLGWLSAGAAAGCLDMFSEPAARASPRPSRRRPRPTDCPR